jgi:hypothetical protein
VTAYLGIMDEEWAKGAGVGKLNLLGRRPLKKMS